MDKHIDIFIKISEQLGSLNSNMQSVLSQLAQHNARLTSLEQGGTIGFKDRMIKYLMIGLIASISVIISLTGASAILQKILGVL